MDKVSIRAYNFIKDNGIDTLPVMLEDLFVIAKRNKWHIGSYNKTVELRKELSLHGIDIDKYDVIFVGYPIWWSDMPMPVYTFLEAHQYEGKTIIPFCTHEGSGLANTENYLRNVCKGAEVLNGLAIRGRIAQNEQEKAKEEVENWLKEINIIK